MKKLTVDNCRNAQEYDDYLKQYIDFYTVTHFFGRGLYTKKHFDSKKQAQKFQKSIFKKSPNARCMIYGISFPPHTVLPVNIPIVEG